MTIFYTHKADLPNNRHIITVTTIGSSMPLYRVKIDGMIVYETTDQKWATVQAESLCTLNDLIITYIEVI